MGRYIEQNESKSDLQQRIAADLRAKASATSNQEGEEIHVDAPDGVEDQEYLRGTKQTTGLAAVWFGLFFAGILVFIFFVYKVNH